jgi:VWFA-related protein
MNLARAIALSAIAVAAAPGVLHGQPPSLATVMERAASYATAFQRQLSNIVAEERYVQDIAHLNLPPGRFATVSHRELRSDVLLVRPAGTDRYVAFRDVFEVDGTPVRDRQDRLTTLFLDPAASAAAQIERINRESARYNIGTIERTINTPTVPLLFLLPQNQSRFRFTRSTRNAPAIGRSTRTPRAAGRTGPASFAAPAEAWVVEYEEIQRPTLIRTTQGLDLPARGRFWTDPDTGRVLMSELITEDPTVRATIDVRYQSDARVGLMVPAEMRERYEGRRDGAVIEGNATYGKIRQFQVQANERIAPAEPNRFAPLGVTAVDGSVGRVLNLDPIDLKSNVADASARAPVQVSPPTPQEQRKPLTFTTGTELVLVDFVVTDKADRPVRGLTVKDFVVKEDGKERPIVSLEAFGGADSAPVSRGSRDSRDSLDSFPRAIESPGSPGSASPDAATALLVDDQHLSPEQAARLRPALKALLAKVGERSGSLLLVAPGSNVSVAGLLPAGASGMTAAVDRIVGQRSDDDSNFPVDDAEALAIFRGDLPTKARVAGRFKALNPELSADQADDLARERANMLAHDARARRDGMYGVALQCLDWLAGRPGRHGLIVVSAGFAQDPDDSKYYEVVTRSLRVNAPIHFLDARGLPGIGRYQSAANAVALGRNVDEGPFGRWEAAAGSMALADETGGIAISNTNDMEKGLGRLLDTMTTYYVVAYQPPEHEKAGYRRIKVEVRTRGLHVRARSGYFSGARPAQ